MRAKSDKTTYRAILKADPCVYCDATSVEIDHIDAAGEDDWSNLTASCRACNARKGQVPLLLAMLGVPQTTLREWVRYPERWEGLVYQPVVGVSRELREALVADAKARKVNLNTLMLMALRQWMSHHKGETTK